MNEKLKVARTVADLARARLVEFDTLYKDGNVSLLVSRRQSSNAFTPLGVNGEPPTEDWGTWFTHDITRTGSNIRILAEFPVTLADLIPEGCTRFEFRNTRGLTGYAKRCPETRRWDITQFYRQSENTNAYFSLDDAQKHFGVDLDTVVPLVADPQYVEERR